MIEVQDILFGVTGQQVYFDCPWGVPTAVASASMFDDQVGDTGAAESALGSPSVESVSLNFNATSGKGQAEPRKLNLASTTGLVRRRRFIATAAGGDIEHVEIARITSATVAYARSPLLQEYTSTAPDTLKSPRLVATVDSTWVADSGNLSDPLDPASLYRVRWVCTVGGATKVGVSWVRLVRYSDLHAVTPVEVESCSPGWLARLPVDDRVGAGERMIAEAARQVTIDLLEHGRSSWVQRNSLTINELVLLKTVLLGHEEHFHHGGLSEDQLEAARRKYERRFNLIREPKTPQQVSADGAGAVPARVSLLER